MAPDRPNFGLEEAVEAIRAGRVIGLPTDTVYGLGVDPLNEDAVGRLFDLKGRPAHKPVGLLVASMEQASTVGEIEGTAAELAADHWPGALTLIVRPKIILADWVGDKQRQTVGVRVPNHPTALGVLEVTGPLSVTSANRTGDAETLDDEEARAVFGDEISVYVKGSCPGGEASTVVDATNKSLTVLRRGPVSI